MFNIHVFVQILANVAANLLVLDICMANAFSTVHIRATLNAQSCLRINENEASWLGKTKATFVTTIYRMIHRTQHFRLSIPLKYMKFWN
jgi:hypothetical protein